MLIDYKKYMNTNIYFKRINTQIYYKNISVSDMNETFVAFIYEDKLITMPWSNIIFIEEILAGE